MFTKTYKQLSLNTMSNEEIIKKGVVEHETEANPVKTASDEVVDSVKWSCSPQCRCSCRAKKEGNTNEPKRN